MSISPISGICVPISRGLKCVWSAKRKYPYCKRDAINRVSTVLSFNQERDYIFNILAIAHVQCLNNSGRRPSTHFPCFVFRVSSFGFRVSDLQFSIVLNVSPCNHSAIVEKIHEFSLPITLQLRMCNVLPSHATTAWRMLDAHVGRLYSCLAITFYIPPCKPFTLYSLLFTHHSSLITHHSLLITHHSSLITHYPSLFFKFIPIYFSDSKICLTLPVIRISNSPQIKSI